MVASAKGCSSRLNVVVPFLLSMVTGTSSASNRPAAMARAARVCDMQSKLVLLLAGNFVMFRQQFGGFAHHHLRHGTEKSVAIHAVDQILIAEAISPAGLEIIRNSRHGFCAAGQNATGIAEQNRLVGERDGFQSRSARFVHGEGRNFLRHAAANGNLPRRIRTAARLPRVAEDGFFYLLGLDSGALDRRLGGHHAHVGRRQRGERSAEFANRRADGGENIDGLQSVSSKTFEFSRAGKDAGRRKGI